ncbi:hypothetical protein [Chryseobacterium sp. Leaf405]|uniref:hypothetical protein n=1 Tax=Chryseobacterium sp. Leaf405 TaxID=1736367 RepID=UPI001039D560|nr:hypothetical protein [Chryseobacterium sp. Leaf405]
MNIFSTLGGFFIQGLIRIVFGILLFTYLESYSKFPILDIVLGNVAYPIKSKITNEIIFDLIISLLITYTISIFIEYYSIKRIKIFTDLKRIKIFTGVMIANTTSYIFLGIWIFYKLNYF